MSNRQIIEIALFTAVAVVLTMISIPMPIPAMSQLGLKLDLSVIFIFLVFNRQGTKAGFISLIITMVLNEIVKPSPFFIGQIAYVSAFIVFYFSYKNKHLLRAVIVTAIVMSIANFFIITPIYTFAYSPIAADQTLMEAYTALIGTKEYLIMIISIYPLFNAIQWSINGIIIKSLTKNN